MAANSISILVLIEKKRRKLDLTKQRTKKETEIDPKNWEKKREKAKKFKEKESQRIKWPLIIIDRAAKQRAIKMKLNQKHTYTHTPHTYIWLDHEIGTFVRWKKWLKVFLKIHIEFQSVWNSVIMVMGKTEFYRFQDTCHAGFLCFSEKKQTKKVWTHTQTNHHMVQWKIQQVSLINWITHTHTHTTFEPKL